jgi:hypothetical protein
VEIVGRKPSSTMKIWQGRFASYVMDKNYLWENFLSATIREEEIMKMRRHEHTGRLLGSGNFVENLENTLGRILKPKKAGRKPKSRQK